VTTSRPRATPEVSLPIAPSVGATGASTCYFRFLKDCLYIKKNVLDPCLMLILGTGDAGAGVLVARGGV
jgi:hypothetical protein